MRNLRNRDFLPKVTQLVSGSTRAGNRQPGFLPCFYHCNTLLSELNQCHFLFGKCLLPGYPEAPTLKMKVGLNRANSTVESEHTTCQWRVDNRLPSGSESGRQVDVSARRVRDKASTEGLVSWWSGLSVHLVAGLGPAPYLGIPDGHQEEGQLNVIEKQRWGLIRQREGLS